MDGAATPHTGLKRELGLAAVTLSGIGIILGAGIYALIGTAAGSAGNAVWLSFAVAAGVAFSTALSYAELASMFPHSAAEYEYTNRSLGPSPAFVIGWLIIFSGVLGAATVALGFAGYFSVLTGVPLIPIGIVVVLLLSAVLMAGIRESTTVACIFTVIEVGGLAAVIVAGFPFIGAVDYLEMPAGIGGVISAAALVFFAFLGFEEMVKFSEEAKNPERTIPKALIIALVSCTVLYILVAVSAVSVVGWEALSQSPAPFSLVAAAAWGPDGALALSVIALFATANTVLLMLFAASRILYGMAHSGALPALLSRVHPGRQTPWAAVLLAGAGAILFLFAGNIGFVAGVTNFVVFVTFVTINITVILLRYRDPVRHRPFRAPGAVGRMPVFPVLGLLSCLFLLAGLEPEVIGTGLVIAGAGAVIAVGLGTRTKEA
jgi:APA family basic amino acid/polyamine antiporter